MITLSIDLKFCLCRVLERNKKIQIIIIIIWMKFNVFYEKMERGI